MLLDSFETVEGLETQPVVTEETKCGAFQNPDYLKPVEGVTYADFVKYCPEYAQVPADAVCVNVDQPPVVMEVQPTGEYVDANLDKLQRDIEEAERDLANAEQRLQDAMDRGGSVISAMSTVDTCRSILETRMRMYSDALSAASAGAKETEDIGQKKAGSVSHKQWELEQAIKNGNSIAIENRRRELAHEIAKEETKKLEQKK